MVLMMSIYRMGSLAIGRAKARSILIQETNLACHNLAREAERSLYESLSVEAGGTSFLSAMDVKGEFAYDQGSSTPLWQNFLVYYFDSAKRELRRRKIPVAGTPVETSPTTLENFAGGPLSVHFGGGQVVARFLKSCSFKVTADQQLEFEVVAETLYPGRNEPDQFKQRMIVNLRN